MPCFHGNITRDQAEELVRSSGEDAFLLRASSVRSCYAMSVYSKASNEIIHYLVYPRSAGGFSIQDAEDTTYRNMNQLLEK